MYKEEVKESIHQINEEAQLNGVHWLTRIKENENDKNTVEEFLKNPVNSIKNRLNSYNQKNENHGRAQIA